MRLKTHVYGIIDVVDFFFILSLQLLLMQVQRETQIQAAQKTMKNRQKQQHGKTISGKSSAKTAASTQSKAHKGRQKETILVTHGHTKNVSHTRLLDGGASMKPISKTHALLEESITGTAKQSSTAPSISTVQRSKTAAILASEGVGDSIHTHSKSVSAKTKKTGGKEIAMRVKRKRRKVVGTEPYSSSENEELDVVTPDSDTTSLSVSLRRDFKSESSHEPLFTKFNEQTRRGVHGNVRLSSEDLASDASDDATQSTEPSSLCIKINRNLISSAPQSLSMEDSVYKPMPYTEQVDDPEHSDSSHDSPSYALECNLSKSTKMVIRTNPLPCSKVEEKEAVGRDEEEAGVGMPSVPKVKVKKKKKKHKHKKVMISDDLKLKISLN